MLTSSRFWLLLALSALSPLVQPQSTISTVIGGAPEFGIPASIPVVRYATAVALDGTGQGWLLSTNDCVRRIFRNGSASLLAGLCYAGSNPGTAPGDGAVAVNNAAGAARLYGPMAMVASDLGTYIADASWSRVRYVAHATGVISTAAGNGTYCRVDTTRASALPANTTCLGRPSGLALLSPTLLLISDSAANVLRVLNTSSGLLSTLAGSGAAPVPASSGNGAAWLAAALNPLAVGVQPSTGQVFWVDGATFTVRTLAPNGTVAHVAGVNFVGATVSPDGVPAATSPLCTPRSISWELPSGNLIVQEGCYTGRTRRILNASGALGTICGGFVSIPTLAEATGLVPSAAMSQNTPLSAIFDPVWNATLVADRVNARLRVCWGNGSVGTVAGPGSHPALTVGLPATSIHVNGPQSLAWEPVTQSILLADTYFVRSISRATGLLNPLWVGQGGYQYGATPAGPATGSFFSLPSGLAPDGLGGFFFSARSGAWNYTYIMRVWANGTLAKAVGATGAGGLGSSGVGLGCSGDGTDALSSLVGLFGPQGLAYSIATGALYIAETLAHVIRAVNPVTRLISTLAGQCNAPGSSGEGVLATQARLISPAYLALDVAGNVYLTDLSHLVRYINITTGFIYTLAGTGVGAWTGAGGPALATALNSPRGLAFDACGNLFIADTMNNVVRKLSPSGNLTTVAGDVAGRNQAPYPGTFGDGGAATAARITQPGQVAVDSNGILLIADGVWGTVRAVSPGGGVAACVPPSPSPSLSPTPTPTPTAAPLAFGSNSLVTFAGGGGDVDVDAVTPFMRSVTALAPDGSGGLLVAFRDCVRWFYGNGSAGILAGQCYTSSTGATPTGDGAVAVNNPAGAARIFDPRALAVLPSGAVVIAEGGAGAAAACGGALHGRYFIHCWHGCAVQQRQRAPHWPPPACPGGVPGHTLCPGAGTCWHWRHAAAG